ncbi:MAG: adenylylsulfate kinase [Verrucomicrobiota bacterium]|jgi:adenylyl-sulfate kinase
MMQNQSSSGCVVWLTGLPAAGKSTIALALQKELVAQGHRTYVLDGDVVRRGLCADLSFSPADRRENVRRVSAVAGLFADAGIICIVALVSPYRADRVKARSIAQGHNFIEVFVNAAVEVCAQRDPKGHYAKARAGELPDFTGVSAPYEPPQSPEIELLSDRIPVADCVRQIMTHLWEIQSLPAPGDRQ